MKLSRWEEISVYACVTGLALVVAMGTLLLTGGKVPEQLPGMIAAVVGFELALAGQDLLARRRAGGQ